MIKVYTPKKKKGEKNKFELLESFRCTFQLNQVNQPNKEREMITKNQEYIDCIDNLKAIGYLMYGVGLNATYGDNTTHIKEALFFLSQNMNSTIENLESNRTENRENNHE